MPRSTPLTPVIASKLHERTGGHYWALPCVVAGTQRWALDQGFDQVSVEHIDAFCDQSAAWLEQRNLIEGYRDRGPRKLLAFPDVPLLREGVRWGWKLEDLIQLIGGDDSELAPESPAHRSQARVAQPPDLAAAARKQFAASRTRKRSAAVKNAHLKSTMDASDGRRDNFGEDMVPAFEKMMAGVRSAKEMVVGQAPEAANEMPKTGT